MSKKQGIILSVVFLLASILVASAIILFDAIPDNVLNVEEPDTKYIILFFMSFISAVGCICCLVYFMCMLFEILGKKVRTKYSVGDTIIYESGNGLKLARVCEIRIYTNMRSADAICIEYEYTLEGYKENNFVQFKLSEENIICEASKRLIKKYMCND